MPVGATVPCAPPPPPLLTSSKPQRSRSLDPGGCFECLSKYNIVTKGGDFLIYVFKNLDLKYNKLNFIIKKYYHLGNKYLNFKKNNSDF